MEIESDQLLEDLHAGLKKKFEDLLGIVRRGGKTYAVFAASLDIEKSKQVNDHAKKIGKK